MLQPGRAGSTTPSKANSGSCQGQRVPAYVTVLARTADAREATSRPCPPSGPQRSRRDEFRPEFVADRIPQPRQFWKKFSCLREIRIVAGAEGYHRRSVGCVVHGDNRNQMMLNQTPGHTQSVDFRAAYIIHLRHPVAVRLSLAFGDHQVAALGYAPLSRLATRLGHGCTTGGARQDWSGSRTSGIPASIVTPARQSTQVGCSHGLEHKTLDFIVQWFRVSNLLNPAAHPALISAAAVPRNGLLRRFRRPARTRTARWPRNTPRLRRAVRPENRYPTSTSRSTA